MMFKHPANIVLSGPSSSGKTSFLYNLLSNLKQLFNTNITNVYIFYVYDQDLYRKIREISNIQVKFVKNISEDVINEILSTNLNPKLFIFDDLMTDLNNTILNLFCRGAHHTNTSIIAVMQNLFFAGKHQRTINLNSQYIILFKSPRDLRQINVFANQIMPKNEGFFMSAYKKAVLQRLYSYLIVDLHPLTPNSLRLKSNIFQPYYSVWVPVNYEEYEEEETIKIE